MKKRWISLLLCLVLLLAACSAPGSQARDDMYLFYFSAETGADTTLVPYQTTLSLQDTAPEDLVNAYLTTAAPPNAAPLLPSGWKLEFQSLSGTTLTLSFQGEATTALNQSLLAACLSETLFQSEQLQRINLHLPGRSESLSLTRDDILLTDTGMLPPQEEVTLYFPDSNHRYLLRETRTVEPMDVEQTCRYIVQQLLDFDDESRSCIPAGTRLLDLSVENGVCTVDFSASFALQMPQSFSAERMAIYSIVNSLTELPEITTVDLWVAGAPLERLYLMDLTTGLVRDERMISTASQGYDVTLSLACGDQLVHVPMQLQLSEDSLTAQTVLEQLLSYETANGIYTPVPAGTKILSVKLDGYVCVIDLTAEFLDGFTAAQEETLAVRSIVSTLCDQPGIAAVELLVEGIAPRFRTAGLNGVLSAEKDWVTD